MHLRFAFDRTRALIVTGAVAFFALLSLSIWVSTLEVPTFSRIYAQEHWVPGQRAAARIVVVNPQTRSLVEGVEVIGLLEGEGGRQAELFRGRAAGCPAVNASFRLPAWPAGDYRMRWLVRTAEEEEEVVHPIRLAFDPSAPGLVVQDVVTALRPPEEASQDGELSFREGAATVVRNGERPPFFYPAGGFLVPNLANIVYAYLPRGSSTATVTYTVDPPGQELRPDPLGLAEFSLTPSLGGGRLVARTSSGAEQVVDLALPPSQLYLQADKALIGAEEEVQLELSSLHGRGNVYLDLWHEGRWLEASCLSLEAGRATATVHLPADLTGIVGWNAYRNFHAPGPVRAKAFVFADPGGESGGALGRLVRVLAAVPGEDRLLTALGRVQPPVDVAQADRGARALFSRLDFTGKKAPLRYESLEDRELRLASFQHHFRRWLNWSYLLLGLGMAAGCGIVLMRHFYRTRSRMAEQEQELEEPVDRLVRIQAGLMLLLTAGVIAAAFVVVMLLVQNLTWGW